MHILRRPQANPSQAVTDLVIIVKVITLFNQVNLLQIILSIVQEREKLDLAAAVKTLELNNQKLKQDYHSITEYVSSVMYSSKYTCMHVYINMETERINCPKVLSSI